MINHAFGTEEAGQLMCRIHLSGLRRADKVFMKRLILRC